MGPNYVLDKGFKVSNGSAAFPIYRFCQLVDENTVNHTTGITNRVIGVNQNRLDADETATGNAQADVRILGISKVEAAGVIALGAVVGPTANGRAQTLASTQFGAGVALQPAAAAGEYIDVLLLPYGAQIVAMA